MGEKLTLRKTAFGVGVCEVPRWQDGMLHNCDCNVVTKFAPAFLLNLLKRPAFNTAPWWARRVAVVDKQTVIVGHPMTASQAVKPNPGDNFFNVTIIIDDELRKLSFHCIVFCVTNEQIQRY